MKKEVTAIISTIIIMICITYTSILYINSKNNKIDTNYIVVFKGEYYNKIYSTYVYEKLINKNNKLKIEYKYVNTEITINTYNDTNSIEKITKTGTVKSMSEIFKKAKKNKAYSYVIYKKSDEINDVYEIDEFKNLQK